jgi:hypothetical protein
MLVRHGIAEPGYEPGGKVCFSMEERRSRREREDLTILKIGLKPSGKLG